MGRPHNKLSATAARKAGPGMHNDGAGLYLRVKGDSRSWVFRFTHASKKREMGLGSAGAVSLADARSRAQTAREQVAQGIDPVDARKATPAPVAEAAITFAAALDRYLKLRTGSWTSAKHRQNWENTLTIHAGALMEMPVDTIRPADVVAVLAPIWTSKKDTARRVRQRIERVLAACIVLDERPEPNPAAWRDRLEFVLDAQPRDVTHHPSVPFEDAPAAFRKFWDRRDAGQGARGLLLAMLLAMRTGEVRGLCWSEVQGDTIVIPKDRMKTKRDHRIALAPRVADWIDTLPRISGTDLVLPSSKLGQISNMTITKALRNAGYGDFTTHGFRSTFSMWANAAGYRRDYIEDALAHQIGNEVERAYRRGDYLEQRRDMMVGWAGYLGA